jgi:CRISPR/Cas system CMR subunit Cmr4 (Cas7 group RAMP superfamily)
MKKVSFRVELETSLVHTEEVSSNISNIFREKVLRDGIVHNIPALHGNSIRGLLRDVGASQLCESLGIENNSLSISTFYKLFSGGSLEKSETIIDLNKKRELRAKLPFLSIFGSALGNEMLQGKMAITSAYPECKELGTGETSYNDLTTIVRYTRVDDSKMVTGEKYTEESEQKQMMFYDIEVLAKGTVLNFEVYLDTDDEIEIACFSAIWQRFLEKPFFGGASRAGHGTIKVLDMSEELKPDAYFKHIESFKEDIKTFLNEL